MIGANIVLALEAAGAEVVAVDSMAPGCGGNEKHVEEWSPKVRFLQIDQGTLDAHPEALTGVRAVFNLAGSVSHALSMSEPLRDLELNLASHHGLLRACARHAPGVPIVFASTRQVYGRPQRLPVDEDHPIQPVDVNGVHKLAAEHLHLLHGRLHGAAVSVLRLTNTYGPRQAIRDHHQGVMGLFARRALEGGEIALYGGGDQKRDFTYVADAVEAFLLAAAAPACAGQVFNLGGEVATLRQAAEAWVRASGRGTLRAIPFPEAQRAIDIGDYYASGERFAAVTGWRPRTALGAGTTAAIEFFEPRKAWYF